MDGAARELRQLIKTFRSQSKAHLVIHGFEQPKSPSAGVLDGQLETSQAEAIGRLNQELRRAARGRTCAAVGRFVGSLTRHLATSSRIALLKCFLLLSAAGGGGGSAAG